MLLKYSLLNYMSLLNCFKLYVLKMIIVEKGDVFLYIQSNQLNFVSSVLKKSLLFNFNSLVDIVCVDWLWYSSRFSLFYNFLSVFYNCRIFLVVAVNVSEELPYGCGIVSLTNIYFSANWLEREVWDLFGIFFLHHSDLRRILTDYGFVGFPLRKDYPLSGYNEIRYDDTKKIIVSEKLKLNQEFRAFNFINPWL
jgi:NADH:ubiquinone oxidoreductase subunit C